MFKNPALFHYSKYKGHGIVILYLHFSFPNHYNNWTYHPWIWWKSIIMYILSRISRFYTIETHDFGYGRAAGVPGPNPIHILVEVEKHNISYTSHSEKCTNSYPFFQISPIRILFWWKRYPIDILLKWKWYRFILLEAWKVYPIQAARLYIPL